MLFYLAIWLGLCKDYCSELCEGRYFCSYLILEASCDDQNCSSGGCVSVASGPVVAPTVTEEGLLLGSQRNAEDPRSRSRLHRAPVG